MNSAMWRDPARLAELIHVSAGAGTGAAWVAARSAGTHWGGGLGGAFGGDGESRKLGLQFPGVALWALGFFFAVDEGFEVMIAFLADVLEDGHGDSRYLLESICGEFANLKCCWLDRVDGACSVSGAALAGGRACADDCQLSASAENSVAVGRRADG
jgi:hypothetical protein